MNNKAKTIVILQRPRQVTDTAPNQSMQRTGGSRFAQVQFKREWRLPPPLMLGRSLN
jgi:hypothetical protein